MAKPVRPHSVPFIVPISDEEGAGFRVSKEALQLLGNIKVPVAPIAVVGALRSGGGVSLAHRIASYLAWTLHSKNCTRQCHGHCPGLGMSTYSLL